MTNFGTTLIIALSAEALLSPTVFASKLSVGCFSVNVDNNVFNNESYVVVAVTIVAVSISASAHNELGLALSSKFWIEQLVTACKRSCGKVMFLHLSVILFTGGSLSRGVSVQEWGYLSSGGGLCPGVGVSVQVGVLCPGVGSLSRGGVFVQGVSF